MENQLKTYCELHWWNMGKKTLYFKGELSELLKTQSITFSKKKTEDDGLYIFTFKNTYITFKVRAIISDFALYAKQFIQMELVRMGDKLQRITFNKHKTEHEGLDILTFKNDYITFKVRGTISDFGLYAKQFIQMELVRMGDKS